MESLSLRGNTSCPDGVHTGDGARLGGQGAIRKLGLRVVSMGPSSKLTKTDGRKHGSQPAVG